MLNYNNIIHIDKNTYKYFDGNEYIEFELYCPELNNNELLLNNDISKDNVMLISDLHPTLETDDPIIALAYKFINNKCIGSYLVVAKVLKSTYDNITTKDILSNIQF